MDRVTKLLSDYIDNNGISLMHLSEKTGIGYQAIYSSLSKKKGARSLRAEEFLKICQSLETDPMRFWDSSIIK